jgi:hypothetical protein
LVDDFFLRLKPSVKTNNPPQAPLPNVGSTSVWKRHSV